MDFENSNLISMEEEFLKMRKRGTIFLIDARKPMFTELIKDDLDLLLAKDNFDLLSDTMDVPKENVVSKFSTALKCCRDYFGKKIISKEKEFIGVVLFGTEKTDKFASPKGVYVLCGFDEPSAENIKIIDKSLIDEPSNEFQQELGCNDDFLLADALWFCSSLFSKSGMHLTDRVILLFTDDSDPHKAFPDKAHMARKRANDLHSVGVNLQVFPMGDQMNYETFYKELVQITNGLDEDDDNYDAGGSGSSFSLQDLSDRVDKMDFPRKRFAKLKLDIGKEIFCGLSFYTLYKEAKVMPTETLSKATNEPVQRVRQTFDATSGELLLPSDIKEFINIADKDVVFSSEEKALLKKVMEPGLTLLGFKSVLEFDVGAHCGTSCFAFPDERLVKGSKTLVSALVEQCLNKKKVALCVLTPRNGAAIKYICLHPSEEEANGEKVTGFHVVPLPFYDWIREISCKPKSADVERETMEDMKLLVTKMIQTGGYKFTDFKNPKLQKFWLTLEALALENCIPERFYDATQPNLEEQAKRLGELPGKLIEACGLNNQPSSSSGKRGTNSAPSTLTKRTKTDDPAFLEGFRKAIAEKKVEKFTVEQLKQFLELKNVDVKGKKKVDLISDVYNTSL